MSNQEEDKGEKERSASLKDIEENEGLSSGRSQGP